MSRVTSRPGAGTRRPGQLRAIGVLAASVLAAGLAACSAPPPDLAPDAAKQLQSQVLAVTQAAAANDIAGSLKLLEELGARLDDAATRGEVSFKRHQGIRTSIDAVRADLTAQQAAAAAAAEAARLAAEQEAAAQAAAKAAAEAAAAAAAAPPRVVIAPAPAPAPAPAQENPGKDGKAKGKDR